MYLVTGGAGFIGCNVVRKLVQGGKKVRILDNFSSGHRRNIIDFLDDIELIEGDIRSYHIVKQAMIGIDTVFHLGALPSVPRSIADPLTTNEVNVQGTLNILHAAVDEKVKRVIFASSSSIYGDLKERKKSENLHIRPLSPYAVSKLAGEKYMQVFHRIYGLETVCLRYFNVFGPYQDPNSQYSAVIPLFIKAAGNQIAPEIYGDGEQSRDFTFVENIVHANLLAGEKEKVEGKVFNIACGGSISVNHLAMRVCELVGKKDLKPVYLPRRQGDIKHSLADISAARELLGYEPIVEFDEGLKRTVEFFSEITR